MSVPSVIDHHATAYSLTHAYWLAQASDLAYKNEATIEEQAERWGFDHVRHHRSQFTPPFPLTPRRSPSPATT